MKNNLFERGDQIAYIPTHANGNIKHPSVEYGFVMLDDGTGWVSCRFFLRSQPETLRTKANSEWTPKENIILHSTIPQSIVNIIIGEIESGLI